MVVYDLLYLNGSPFYNKKNMKVRSSMSENNTSDTFSLTLDNRYGANKDQFNIGDEIIIYSEQDVTPPTVKIVGGYVNNVDFQGIPNRGTININGRGYYSILQDATVPPVVYRNIDAGSMVKHLIDTNTSGLNTGSINVSTGHIIEYKRINHLHVADAIKEVAEEMDYINYVNPDKYVMYEPKNSSSVGFTLGSHNVLQSRLRFTDDDMANEIYVYGDRVLTASPTTTQTSDGAGSVIQLAFKPFNTEVSASGTTIVKGGIYHSDSTPLSGVQYLVDFEEAKIIWTSGTGIGNNIPGSLTISTVKYDRMLPIVKYIKDDMSIDSYGKKSKVIINKAIKDPIQATDIAVTEILNNSSPKIQGQIDMDGVYAVIPGQQVTINLPNENIDNQTYQIVEAQYDFTPKNRQNNQVLTLKLNKRLMDVTDTIKQMIIDLRKLQAGDIDENDILTRIEYTTGSYGLRMPFFKIYDTKINDSFIVDHPENGILGVLGSPLEGTVISGTWISGIMGYGYDKAISLTGSPQDSKIIISGLTSQFPSGTGTITGWFNPDIAINNGMLFHIGSANSDGFGTQDEFHLTHLTTNGSLSVYASISGTAILNYSTNALINNGTWHHTALTWTGSNTYSKLYYNGSLMASGLQNNNLTMTNIQTSQFGGVPNDTGSCYAFDGGLDDWRIYSKELSQTEIGSIYEKALNYYPTGSMTAYLKFDEGSGTAVYSSTSGGQYHIQPLLGDRRTTTLYRLDSSNDYFETFTGSIFKGSGTAFWNLSGGRLCMSTTTTHLPTTTYQDTQQIFYDRFDTINQAKITAVETKWNPADSIRYFVSTDNQTSWQEITKNVWTALTPGSMTFLKILFTGNGNVDTYVDELSLKYTTV